MYDYTLRSEGGKTKHDVIYNEFAIFMSWVHHVPSKDSFARIYYNYCQAALTENPLLLSASCLVFSSLR